MIDFDVLKSYGTTNESLQALLQAKPPSTRLLRKDKARAKKMSDDHEKAQDLIDSMRDKISEGVEWSLKHAHHFAAADLMWDSTPILPENIPLIQYAQGKIKIESCIQDLEDLNCSDKFIESKTCQVDGEEKVVKELNLPRFFEVAINLGRSYINRRLYAQTNKYNSQTPFLRFETKHRNTVGVLRAEAMSQYAETMANSFGYRHNQTQFTRDMLMYGLSVNFPECAWEDERQIISKGKDEKGEPIHQTVITKEGVPFANMHPTRVFYDRAYPISSINTDTGTGWVAHWDVKRWSEISRMPGLFNKDKVKYSSSFPKIVAGYSSYFDLYFANDPINLKPKKQVDATALADQNNREVMGTYYAAGDDDQSVVVTDFRIKVIPKDAGFGTYPHPVWIRVLMASDDTPVFAEILPSRPAFVAAFNLKDDRLVNLGQMHEIMPFEDQMKNLMSQCLMVMKHSLLRIVAINGDVVSQEVIDKITEDLQGDRYYMQPHVLVYSKAENDEIGVEQRQALEIVNGQSETDYINNAFKAMTQLLNLLERLLMLSPQEQGQPAPREISATESAMLEATTSAVYSAISEAIDEARSAQKIIIHESAMALGSNEIRLPVTQTFSRDTIEKAGFRVADTETTENPAMVRNNDWTILGTKEQLKHDYLFTHRDGSDRPTNTQTAQTLIALLSQVIPLVGPETLGKDRIFGVINEIFRLLGVYNLRIDMTETEAPGFGGAEQQAIADQSQQLAELLQEQGVKTDDNSAKIDELAQALERVASAMAPPAEAQQLPQ